MSEVSSKAVEALAEQFEFYLVDTVDQPGTFAAKVTVEQIEGLARLALAAHQPARVVPSAEEVARTIFASRWPTLDWGRHSAHRRSAERDARAVLALYASQPTVAQVREQAAREIEAAGHDDDRWLRTCDDYRANGWEGDPDDYERMFWAAAHNDAARIARTETKGGE